MGDKGGDAIYVAILSTSHRLNGQALDIVLSRSRSCRLLDGGFLPGNWTPHVWIPAFVELESGVWP